MIHGPDIFRTTESAKGLFDFFFGGMFLIKGIPITLQLGLYVLFPTLIVLLLCNFNKLARSIAYGIFLISTLLLFQPWDEVFVNLMHSYHLFHDGVFSFSNQVPTEGTVDFLPYFILGCLAKLGLPLLELLFFQGILGGILCIWIGQKLLAKLGFSRATSVGLSVLALYPPLMLNSSSGFTTPYFTAILLMAVYWLLYEEKINLGFFLLSLLPLIRVEGVGLVLLWGIFFFHKKNVLKWLLSFIPFVLLSAWRYDYFGSVIPNPVLFKASLGSFFFFVFGMRNFLADMISTHTITTLSVLLLLAYLLPRNENREKAYRVLKVLFLFSAPYYLSGGDWFPSSWGRYFLPISFLSLILAVASLAEFFKTEGTHKKVGISALFVAILVFESLALFGSWQRYIDYAIAPRKVLAEIRPRNLPAIPYRTHYLSQVGLHFLHTTDKSDKIATSELATINYFAEREAIDTLGITNKEISSQPLRETPSLWRKAPLQNELPYLIFKRLNQGLVYKSHPEFIYAFDFMLKTILKDVPQEEWTNENLLLAYKRWQTKFKGLTTPIYGDWDRMDREGYSPVIVVYGNDFSTLYFVSKETKEKHFASLKANGFVKE